MMKALVSTFPIFVVAAIQKISYNSNRISLKKPNCLKGNDRVKIFKLIVGILCILLACFVAYQTFYLGYGHAAFKPLEIGGTAALIGIAVLFLCGLIMVSTFKSNGVGGEVFCILIFTIGTVAAVLFRGNIPGLQLWAVLCLAPAVINLISLFTK